MSSLRTLLPPLRRVLAQTARTTTSQQTTALTKSSSRRVTSAAILPRRPSPREALRTIPATFPTQRRNLFIQTETTPNADALKFLPGTPLLSPNQTPLEFLSGRTSHASPLARKLFALDGITSIFIGPDFITVTKTSDANWAYLKPEVFSLITESLNNGEILVDPEEGLEEREDTKYVEGDSEAVSMIKELLDTRIRPAIQEDGGDIEYRGFEDGWVMLKLKGACRTCDSSTVTLRNGIESMLMHYVEEVKGVKQVLDPEEEIALQEFEKFEENLKKMKHPTQSAESSSST